MRINQVTSNPQVASDTEAYGSTNAIKISTLPKYSISVNAKLYGWGLIGAVEPTEMKQGMGLFLRPQQCAT